MFFRGYHQHENNENKWLQASLPINRGGIGIRRIEDISLSAFLSSTFGV